MKLLSDRDWLPNWLGCDKIKLVGSRLLPRFKASMEKLSPFSTYIILHSGAQTSKWSNGKQSTFLSEGGDFKCPCNGGHNTKHLYLFHYDLFRVFPVQVIISTCATICLIMSFSRYKTHFINFLKNNRNKWEQVEFLVILTEFFHVLSKSWETEFFKHNFTIKTYKSSWLLRETNIAAWALIKAVASL